MCRVERVNTSHVELCVNRRSVLNYSTVTVYDGHRLPSEGPRTKRPVVHPRPRTFAAYPSQLPSDGKLGRKRCFRADWFNLHPWLEYSQVKDAAFCYACRHFPSLGKIPETAFTSVGFRNWKKAQYKDAGFATHVNGDFHRSAVIMWQEHKNIKSTAGSVLQLQNKTLRTTNR